MKKYPTKYTEKGVLQILHQSQKKEDNILRPAYRTLIVDFRKEFATEIEAYKENKNDYLFFKENQTKFENWIK